VSGRPSDADLLRLAKGAMARAHAPYSGYTVGAVLEDADGRTHIGVNVENAAYATTICAERAALARAVADGARRFRRLALVSNGVAPFPCGACRQALSEFDGDLEILVRGPRGVTRSTLGDLLPHAFRLPVRRSRGGSRR
jgi:cytidine deaminase